MSLEGTPCFSNGTIDGDVTGNRVEFEASAADDSMEFRATVGQSGQGEMSGTYSVSGGPCEGDTGSFSLHTASRK